MAKQIKVIKCPNCGSVKVKELRPDYYQCESCSTEFFLDSDDVNVNVNYRQQPANNFSLPSKNVFIPVILGVAVVFVVIFFNIIMHTGNTPPPAYAVAESNAPQAPKCLFSLPLPANGQGVVFYLISKNADSSTVAVFQGITTGKIIKKERLSVFIPDTKNVDCRWFESDSAYYVVVNGKFIYKINAAACSFTNITADMCARKPALNAGLMKVQFVPEGQGEGFCMNTNLGRELYYFPKTDILCTKNAFRMMQSGSFKLPPDAKNSVYYLFLNTESTESSNVAQLFEVTYKFNNGAPENKLMSLSSDEETYKLPQYRIVSCKPITEKRIYFAPGVLYCDSKNILIFYRPTLAPDAAYNVQLLDTAGKIIWTVPLGNEVKNTHVARTNQGFIVQVNETEFYEISADGTMKQDFKISSLL